MSDDVCGIRLPEWARTRWPGWFAPERLPFALDDLSDADRAALPAPTSAKVAMELQDTFWIYPADRPRLWLDRIEFDALPTGLRRRLVSSQRDEHEVWLHGPTGRFGPWWPDALGGDVAPIVEFIERDRPPSRHTDVSDATWDAAAALLPGARELAGTFAEGSGPNCFGTVMAAAGVESAATQWMQREPFECWLARHTQPVRGTAVDHDPGTVLVWRDADGVVQHACVTLGDGWVLNKPSQGWMSPRFVWSVEQTKRHTREVGRRLHRYRITLSPDREE